MAAALLPAPAVPTLGRPVPGVSVRAFGPPEHLGLDLEVAPGAPVVAPVSGAVSFAGAVADQVWVTISPEPDVLVTVGALASLSVSEGQRVEVGQRLGSAAGSPGHDHPQARGLHLSVRVSGRYVDPAPLLGLVAAPGDHARLVPESVSATPPTGSPEAVLDALAKDRMAKLPIPFSGRRSRAYVAFGDSLTTGFSVPSCDGRRDLNRNGCSGPPTVVPYPDRVASALGIAAVDRVGVWGYTAREAVTAYHAGRSPAREGGWEPQLAEVDQAGVLVTGALGINDLHFGDVRHWAWLLLQRQVDEHVAFHLGQMDGDLTQLFGVLRRARERGAKVVVPLYYNPYDSGRCIVLPHLADKIVGPLDAELARRAEHDGLAVADLRAAFAGHGAGSPNSYVFGRACDLATAALAYSAAWNPFTLPLTLWRGGPHEQGERNIQLLFDPHPNSAGTAAMAQAVLEVIS